MLVAKVAFFTYPAQSVWIIYFEENSTPGSFPLIPNYY